jgi:hypothetical protein
MRLLIVRTRGIQAESAGAALDKSGHKEFSTETPPTAAYSRAMQCMYALRVRQLRSQRIRVEAAGAAGCPCSCFVDAGLDTLLCKWVCCAGDHLKKITGHPRPQCSQPGVIMAANEAFRTVIPYQ